jgi:acetyltransferase-like isoleucine patch superfamily enzyme
VIKKLLWLMETVWILGTSRLKTLRCKRVGSRVRIWGKVIFGGDVYLDSKVRIRASHVPVEIIAGPGAKILIGEGSFINSGCSLGAEQLIRIGKNVAIGNYSLIMDSDFHAIENHTDAGASAPVIIEDDVWIGARVTILKGVQIGHGAVVAAGAVVTKNVASRTLVAGVPARVIRELAP